MTELNFHKADHVKDLIWPPQKADVTINSSALEIFTDFSQQKPLVIEDDTNAAELEHLMRKAHVRLKIVIDKNNQFVGLVSLDDLVGPNRVKKVAQGNTMEDLTASDFMKPKADLSAIEYSELKRASISDVIDALKRTGSQHCLVIDGHSVRGVISTSDIAKKLRIDIDLSSYNSFAKLYEVMFDHAVQP